MCKACALYCKYAVLCKGGYVYLPSVMHEPFTSLATRIKVITRVSYPVSFMSQLND